MTKPLGILWASPLGLEGLPAPRFGNRPDHPHVTLAWGVPRDPSLEGLLTSVWLQAECWDDRIQAARCVLQAGIPFALSVPHLTLSWVDGARSVEAAKMIQYGHAEAPLGDLLLPARLEWVELSDSIGCYRSKILSLMQGGESLGAAAKALGIPRTTAQSWFTALPDESPQKAAYLEACRSNKGGWQRGRSRNAK